MIRSVNIQKWIVKSQTSITHYASGRIVTTCEQRTHFDESSALQDFVNRTGGASMTHVTPWTHRDGKMILTKQLNENGTGYEITPHQDEFDFDEE